MKLSRLKPCVLCHGPCLKPPCGQWYVVRVCGAMLHPEHARSTLAMNLHFNGALGLAEVMAPAADKAVTVLGDEEPKLMTELHVCFDCYVNKLGNLASAVEAANEPELEGASQ